MRLVCKRWLAVDDAFPEEPTRLALQLAQDLQPLVEGGKDYQYLAYHLQAPRRLVQRQLRILRERSLFHSVSAFGKLSTQAHALRVLELSPPTYSRNPKGGFERWRQDSGVYHTFSLLALLTQLRELRLTDWNYKKQDILNILRLSSLVNLEVQPPIHTRHASPTFSDSYPLNPQLLQSFPGCSAPARFSVLC